MHGTEFRALATMRTARAPDTGGNGGNDPNRVQRSVPRDRGGAVWPGDARLEGLVPPAGGSNGTARPLFGGGQRASGGWRADGGAVGADGVGLPAGGPRFDRPVRPGGYAWWYIDALSDDGRHAITLIAFIGSVFSPYYAWARRRGPGDPFRHVALNVALYGERRGWAMTERGAGALERGAEFLSIGPSALTWDGNALTIRIEEITTPIPSRIRGVVRIYPHALEQRVRLLDAAGRHRWCPIAASARAEIALEQPAVRWSGGAYFDTNEGDAPLETDFLHWTWSRSITLDGTEILYDLARRDGSHLSLALRYAREGGGSDFQPLATIRLPSTRWGITRVTRAGSAATGVQETLEDTPFYARSILANGRVRTMHESLSLDRFRSPWVQAMLPFRMPRVMW